MDAGPRGFSPATIGCLSGGSLGHELEQTVAHLLPPLPASNSSRHVDEKHKDPRRTPRWRWFMLAILSLNICVSYLPYYTFVPILSQGMDVYDVDEPDLNALCIVYALVYVPCAFLTGPLLGSVGCRWAFVISMALTTCGCALRCGPNFVAELLQIAPLDKQSKLHSDPATNFAWLLFGQTLCALGQPFLVNSTSQVGAEWFPPHERPAAAMISNLMNFVGSSLSFVMPPLVVSQQPKNIEHSSEQISTLMRMQLWVSVCALLVTALFYQPSPALASPHRQSVSFLTEIKGFLRLRDFWLVNFQFMIYVSVCHAFDAVEGALLEHYGYHASLSSWTAVACAATSILSTIAESIYITDPSSYQNALVIVNIILAISQVVGCFCLYFNFHEAGFIIAVGIMGLSTPGWGCSIELGSEVCFPAHEATVSSLLEACSNLMGVAGIIVMQRLLDAGLGAGVMLLMAVCSLMGGGMMCCLSGQLRRSDAEHNMDDDSELHSNGDAFDSPKLVPTSSKSPIDDEKNHGLALHRKVVLRLRNWYKALAMNAPQLDLVAEPGAAEWTDSNLWAISSSGL